MEMKDNRKVSDSHQEGIGRVVQREHEKRDGHNGKMGSNGKGHSEKGFCVPNNAKTPRRA
jgi:hypothetical protein